MATQYSARGQRSLVGHGVALDGQALVTPQQQQQQGSMMERNWQTPWAKLGGPTRILFVFVLHLFLKFFTFLS